LHIKEAQLIKRVKEKKYINPKQKPRTN